MPSSIRPRTQLHKVAAVVGATAWILAGCSLRTAVPEASLAQATVAPACDDIGQLDGLVSPKTLFPEPTTRALYVLHTPQTHEGRRSYVFELKAQPGMVANRHFHLITITWAPAGSFPGASNTAQMSSTGGPGGAIIDATTQTTDNIYDLRVSEAILLPDTVRIPSFDPIRAANALVEAYAGRCQK